MYQLKYIFLNFILFNFTVLYWFCHISKWICHRYTCVPHPEPSSLLPPHTIPLGHPSAPAPSIQYRASNLDWRLVPYMILYIFQCHSPKSSHPLPLPQSPKDCSIHQCLFCCTDPIFNQIPWKLWVWGGLRDFRTRTKTSDRYKSRAGGRSLESQKKGRELLRVSVGLWDDASPAGRQAQLSRGDSGGRITD